ncbi:MAG: di-trans,poly-cis-decaprenylcistransferase [Clostridia bacterium]|nr:di-trans,poly-cis-decaprenylcistransferase [Clostridia bacterium]
MFRKKKQNAPQPDIIDIVKSSGLRHIAYIMDGNGRWATSRSLPRELGHSAGAKNFKEIVRYSRNVGIRYVTVYAFSTENWKRPEREVAAIMKLLDQYIDEAALEDEIEFLFIGDRDSVDSRIRERMSSLEKLTVGRPFRVNIAFNYGGRNEIVYAVNRVISDGRSHITEKDISDNVYTSDCPDPDLIVRTGAEYRISNFLMWQSAYSELYFSDKMWPEFKPSDVDDAIIEFSKRKRRFGGV